MKHPGGRFAELEVDGRVVDHLELATSYVDRRGRVLAVRTMRPGRVDRATDGRGSLSHPARRTNSD